MVNELLVNLVNSVLGTGKRTARGNQSYHCPKCNHHKPKLEINFDETSPHYQYFACWVCGFKGKSLLKLFKQINVSREKLIQLRPFSINKQNFNVDYKEVKQVALPKEYKIFQDNNDIIAKHALSYLKSRKISNDDILKYNIGYCDEGEYKNMIIIPSYDCEGKLNYFTGRSFEKEPFKKYQNPDISRDIIPFELFINWNLPIIICEGAFDAIAIKRNAIPLLGKNIQQNLMKKIISSTVKKIYLALDKDALKQTIKFAEYFIDQGKEVYILELNKKDPSELGFHAFTHLIQETYPLDEYKLMEQKLKLL
jgi:DNA primase